MSPGTSWPEGAAVKERPRQKAGRQEIEMFVFGEITRPTAPRDTPTIRPLIEPENARPAARQGYRERARRAMVKDG